MVEIKTLAALAELDQDAILSGYRAGWNGTPDYTRRDQAYWHGHLNALADLNPNTISAGQRELARAYFANQRAH